MHIPFSEAFLTGKEIEYIKSLQSYSGDGSFTRACHEWLQKHTPCHKALLTHSCTAALEMAALLIDIQPGDEVIMPSYTFVSTANAFVLRGGVPVFVDIREDTLNIDENLIESAITEKTRAIVPVHYAGVACEMDTINQIAKKYQLKVIEDAAQGVMASYKGKALGTLSDLGAFSFHATKNIISGEGGALIINNPKLSELAEIIREKGTDRSRFYRGEIDKYTWQHLGSSFLPSELIAAFLFAQFEKARDITQRRISIWNNYHENLNIFEENHTILRPKVPEECQHNGHLYYILLKNIEKRADLIAHMKNEGICSVFHYVPLHASPGGKKYARTHGEMNITNSIADRIVRLPLYQNMSDHNFNHIITTIKKFFHNNST